MERHADAPKAKKSKITQQFDKPKNEGEGSYEGTRAYDASVREFVESGSVEEAAEAAKQAVDGAENAELVEAETIGKRGGTDIERGSDTRRGRA